MSKLAVLMPVFNGDKDHVKLAIESILNQTYKSFEFIIVNDGSNQEISNILTYYVNKDSRLILIENGVNLGIVASLNKGLLSTSASIIARHDADDIAMPDRLEKQLAYLDKNLEVDVCFTAANIINPSGEFLYTFNVATEPKTIAVELFFNSRLRHPTLMARKIAFFKVGLYKEHYPYAEDYELFCSFVESGCLLHGIDIPLMDYRIDFSSKSPEQQLLTWEAAEKISYRYFNNRVNESIDREAFKKFWFLVFTQHSIRPFNIKQALSIYKVLKILKNDHMYKTIWWEEIKWRCKRDDKKNKICCLILLLMMQS